MSDELTKLVNSELDNNCPFCPDLIKDNEAKNAKILEARKMIVQLQHKLTEYKIQVQTLLQMNRNQTELLEERDEEIKELLLADTKNTEIVERLMKEAEGVSEDAWDSLLLKNEQLEAQLIQANLDIIRLEKRNDTMHKDYDLLVEVITEQDAEITRLKSNQSKFSG